MFQILQKIMSAHKLVKVFEGLGQPIDPENVGWMFTLPSPRIQAFLHWMCNNLKPDNVLGNNFDSDGIDVSFFAFCLTPL